MFHCQKSFLHLSSFLLYPGQVDGENGTPGYLALHLDAAAEQVVGHQRQRRVALVGAQLEHEGPRRRGAPARRRLTPAI